MDVKNIPIMTSDDLEIIETLNGKKSSVGVSDRIVKKSHGSRSRTNCSALKKPDSFAILGNDIPAKNKQTLNFENKTLGSSDSEKECSPYKSPTVLSFDAYGNLTSSDDPDAPYSHEVPSLAEFDYILGSFEGRFQNQVEEVTVSSNKNGAIKKSKPKKIKHDSGNSEPVSISDKDLKQAFKKDFDTTSASVTSRYGRTRKQKAQDGFLFGTINFNELRKITSTSPKKNRHSSSSEGKSDSESYGLEDLHTSISQNFEPLSDKIPGYSSEEEFVSENKTSKKVKSMRRRTLPTNIESSKESIKSSPKENKKKNERNNNKRRKHESSSTNEKRCTRSRTGFGEEIDKGPQPLTPDHTLCNNHTDDSESNFNENMLDSLSKENTNVKKMVKKSNYNVKKTELEELGSIQEDVNIIKSSLADSETSTSTTTTTTAAAAATTTTTTTTPNKEPEIISEDSNNIEFMYESKTLPTDKEDQHTTQKSDSASTAIEVEPKIIKMETLNEEVKPEESLKTKYGRQVKKPVLIDVTVEEEKRRKEASEKHKQTVSVIEEDFLDNIPDIDLKTEKENPCTYFIGDLVWVNMKGNPLWPGMITYPKNETTYTRINRSPTTFKLKGPRQYHVQFFYDNNQTMWVSSPAIFSYEGLPKLVSLIEDVKETAKTTKNFLKNPTNKNTLKTYAKLHAFIHKDRNSHSKTFQWHQAVEEADKAVTLDRYERLQEFQPHIKKSVRPSSINTRKRKLSKSRISKTFMKSETSSTKSKSSDDFSGFDDDSSVEKRKTKRIKLDKIKQGDFEVYLQKHLETTIKDSNLSREKAKELLKKKWKKLTPVQKSRYKSKLGYDPSSSMDTDDSSSSDLSSLASFKSKKSSTQEDDGAEGVKGMYRVPKYEKVCINCENVSFKSGADMVKCRGVCGSVFHLSCVGLDTAPNGDFRCAACLSGLHKCFICKSEEGERIRCSAQSCGKFYHDHCVKTWPQVSKARQTEKLVCPRHVCHMCAANADDMNDPAARTPPFTRCLRCPSAYHTGETCIAAGADEVSQSHHICTKHMKIPKNSSHHFNVNWCFCCSKGGSLLLCDQCPAAFHAECLNITAPEGSFICEDCENGKFPVYGDIVWVKLGQYRWWPGEVLHPRYIPDNIENLSHVQGMFCVHFFGSDDYYWMSRGRTFHYQEGDQGSKSTSSKFLEQQFQKALGEAVIAYRKQKERRDRQEQSRSLKGNLKPPPYVKIDTNKPVGNVRLGKLDPSTATRCDCDPYSENPCGSDDKCINRMLMVECIREVCAGKDRCNNQRFQRRQYPNVYPFKTSGRGWGLKTKEFIKKGDFVIEYVGELIDEAEFRRRIDEMHDYKEENYYFLTVETDRLIDAGPKGNLARFMNHSCQPNCETQKWTVGADTKVGLFALEDIPEGSELTFNYNLQCVGTEKKKCNCGSPNCSGYIGVKVQKPECATIKKPKLENGIKKKKRGKKKKSEKDSENECFRCGQAGDLILCDMTMCPKGYHLECLGLKELPKGKWLCPWHHCDECGSRASNRCIMCPNSYCRYHSAGKFHSTPGLGNVCLEHGTEDIQAGSDESGSELPSSREHSPEVPT